MSEEQSEPPSRRSWLERFGLTISGEPRNRDELLALLRDAQQRGLLDGDALAMMEGVLAVSEMRVRDVMVPRAQMVMVGLDWPLAKLLATVVDSGHSRLPVIDDDRDDIVGVLIVKDLLRYFAEGGGELALRDLLRPAKFIPESKRLNALLKEFRSSRLHMAIVVDEYGGVAGLVTIEDVLEQIVGEIDDEHDETDDEDDIRPLTQNRYLIRALTPVEDFNHYFHSNFSDDKADTIGGLVMMEFGHLPKRGELIEVEGYRFRVVRADSRRVYQLELTLSPVTDSVEHADRSAVG